MQQEFLGPVNSGKRIFIDLMNQSNSSNMYPVDPNPIEQKNLYHRRNTSDFRNKTYEKYIPPPVSKLIEKKHSWVHNTLANKTQSNHEFVERMRSGAVLTPARRKIIKTLHDHGIDFRMLSAFKNAMFDSE